MGILSLAPTNHGSRIAFICKIEQREAHAVFYWLLTIYNNADIHRCFFFDRWFKICEILARQRKTSVNVFLYVCLAFYTIQTASNVRHCKSKIFLDWEKKNVGIYYFQWNQTRTAYPILVVQYLYINIVVQTSTAKQKKCFQTLIFVTF